MGDIGLLAFKFTRRQEKFRSFEHLVVFSRRFIGLKLESFPGWFTKPGNNIFSYPNQDPNMTTFEFGSRDSSVNYFRKLLPQLDEKNLSFTLLF